MSESRSPRYVLDIGWSGFIKDMDIPIQDVLRHAQLPLDLLARKAPTVTADEYFRLWEGLAHVLRDEPTFPLRMAETLSPDNFSPALFASLCSANMTVALKRIAQYKPIVGPVRLLVEQHDQRTTAIFQSVQPNGTLPPSIIAFELAFWVQMARIGLRDRITPLAVYTTVALPEKHAYDHYFGVTVQPGDFDALVFSTADATRPFLTVNEAMWSIFEPELRKRLDDLTQESPFRERVRASLIEILASGQTSVSDVAVRLAVSSRTLQRRLKAENTSFQKVLDELREELARHYLTQSDYSSGQIAFLLGYEEPNSFFRAFRTWTGQTPEYVRATVK